MMRILLFLLTPLSLNAATPQWQQFRGPNSQGIAEDARPPIEFGPKTNLLWKTELPSGVSSPCLWKDRIFITAFSSNKLETLCIDRLNGRVIWRQPAPSGKVEQVHDVSSPASATPATDGERVYVYVPPFGLVAYDFDGKEQWRKALPIDYVLNGNGTSPALIDGRVIINGDQQNGKSFLIAVEGRSGKTLWEIKRPEFATSYTTPIFWEHDGAKEAVVAGSLYVVGYDLRDGKERWRARGLEAVSVAPTPVLGDGRLYVMSRSFGGAAIPPFASITGEMDKNDDKKIARTEVKGFLAGNGIFEMIDLDKDGFINESDWNTTRDFIAKGEHGIFALRTPGTGDVTQTHVEWKNKKGVAGVSSPLFYQGRIFVVQDGGRATCYDAKTGKIFYEQERIGAEGEFYASPVAADGKIYTASTRGKVTVIESGEALKVVGQNDLGESIMATPALVGNAVYIRTAKNLWAFGKL